MIKQRICIVGDGLSGLMTAVVLSKVPGIDVNLIAKKGIPYVFNLGHGLLPETDPDKVDKLIKFYRNF